MVRGIPGHRNSLHRAQAGPYQFSEGFGRKSDPLCQTTRRTYLLYTQSLCWTTTHSLSVCFYLTNTQTVNKIMALEEPDDNVVNDLRNVFVQDVGRRIFSHILRQYVVDVRGSIPPNAFNTTERRPYPTMNTNHFIHTHNTKAYTHTHTRIHLSRTRSPLVWWQSDFCFQARV